VVSAATLPPWSEGTLDIHYINTGICESAFYILPDGTTMLVDAGAAYTSAKPHNPYGMTRVPNDSLQPGQWIARYISRVIPPVAQKRINYALLTHYHGDHMGTLRGSKSSRIGPYLADGITEVPDYFPYDKLIDRAFPTYNEPYPEFFESKLLQNYKRFVQWQMNNNNLVAERFRPGAADQITLVHAPEKYPNFTIRNLAANGIVWTGEGTNTRRIIPHPNDLPKSEEIEENNLSLAFRINYGKFKFYAGGDLSYKNVLVAPSPEIAKWRDIETPVAQACGHVDVMKANHHGSHDANSAPFLRLLSPRVIVIATRNPQQPFVSTFRRMTSTDAWPGPRDIFMTNLLDPNRLFLRLPEKLLGHRHVVIRVQPGGDQYSVFQIDDSNEKGRILSTHGPYQSQ
jgi:beta-lactamase superfamily II metal-dependent hydrolase